MKHLEEFNNKERERDWWITVQARHHSTTLPWRALFMMRLSNSRCGIKLAANGRGVTDGYCALACSLQKAACRSSNSIMLICSSTALHGGRPGSARKPANKTMDMNLIWFILDNCWGSHMRLSSLCVVDSVALSCLSKFIWWRVELFNRFIGRSLNTCKAKTKEYNRWDRRNPKVISANMDWWAVQPNETY